MLQDAARNEAILGVLEAHAPGARVLEIGSGTGVFACAAARLGAREVYAVELSETAALVRALAEDNELEQLEVLHGHLGEFTPRPVDLIVSELLNADPFAEGLLETYDLARPWLAPGGRIFPSSLEIRLALVEDETPAEVRRARSQVAAMAQRFDLVCDRVDEFLHPEEPYRYLAPSVTTLGSAPLVTLDLLQPAPLPDMWKVEVRTLRRGRVGGAAVLFEAAMGASTFQSGGHFGVLVQGFPEAIDLPAGGAVHLEATLDEERRFLLRPVAG